VGALAVVFAAELACASLAFDGSALANKSGAITHLLDILGAPLIQFAVAFCAIVATFSFLDHRTQLAEFSEAIRQTPVRLVPLAVHLAAMTAFAFSGANLYMARQPAAPPDLLTVAFLVSAATGFAAAALAALPLRLWIEAAAIPGAIWAWAAGAALAVSATTAAVRSLWSPAAAVTFQIVRFLLQQIVPLTVVDPTRLKLGTAHFKVTISPACSGLEGVSLLLLFGSLWLILFRKDCRFPQALLLLPLGAIVLFLVNSVRIAALVLIGSAGARQIATEGFHSQAGWMSFNAVSLGLCVAARQLPWFTTYRPSQDPSAPIESRATTAYLMPLLAILAAGMVARAASGGFEWLYPLHLFAPLAVFWFYRREYGQIDWRIGSGDRFGWTPFLATVLFGALVFVCWIGLDRILGTGSAASMPSPLRQASAPVRTLWIALRALSAVVTVPIAEELAFRGFLIRRVLSREFETLPPANFSWTGVLISSAVFGLLHGARWPAGVLAGLIYSAVFLRRGRLSDAILAHATTNALLAGAVLVFGAWQYW
jgi:exosortase E/protease (VPEID-CTERM system)